MCPYSPPGSVAGDDAVTSIRCLDSSRAHERGVKCEDAGGEAQLDDLYWLAIGTRVPADIENDFVASLEKTSLDPLYEAAPNDSGSHILADRICA